MQPVRREADRYETRVAYQCDHVAVALAGAAQRLELGHDAGIKPDMHTAILGALRLDSDRSERQHGAAEKSPAPNGRTRGSGALGLGGKK
jgi:hypothetical protein